jgi:hypothetical protein
MKIRLSFVLTQKYLMLLPLSITDNSITEFHTTEPTALVKCDVTRRSQTVNQMRNFKMYILNLTYVTLLEEFTAFWSDQLCQCGVSV